MKTRTLTYRLALLLLPISLHAQNSLRSGGNVMRPMPPFYPGIKRAWQTSNDERAPFVLRDYLLHRLYPPAAFNPSTAKEMMIAEQMHRFMNGSPDLYADRSHPLTPAKLSDNVQEAWVSHFSSGQAPGIEHALDVAIDPAGNVYVTGASLDMAHGMDYLTAKYDPSGSLLWTARFNGEGSTIDVAVGLGVDSLGNVYVTGSNDALPGSSALVTIKYDTHGAQQWVARYDGAGNHSVYATALAMDGMGNICVTGYLYDNQAGGPEYVTIKYDANGVGQWLARYAYGIPVALAIDRDNNVLVTGWCHAEHNPADFATVKYNENGVQQWVSRYNGPANNDDLATALVTDGQGNVYVMGESRGDGDYYATVKYNREGTEQWVARFGPGAGKNFTVSALAVDDSGNVYAAGAGVQGHDYMTIKYNPSGEELWRANYDGPGDHRSGTFAIALDKSANVVVTGATTGAGTSWDCTTVKYDASGRQQWVARYNGPSNYLDYAYAMAIDGAGNIYVAGSSEAPETGRDFTTIKYDAGGDEQWVARYNKEGNSNDNPAAMAIDDAGNVYIAGRSEVSSTGYDYITIKYNHSGRQEWVARYDGPAHGYDAAIAIALDRQGNVYVCGSSEHTGSHGNFITDFATLKYNSAGLLQWVALYDGPEHSRDVASAIAVDESGNAYVTGWSMVVDSAGFFISGDYATIKYNPDGVEQWVSGYDGPQHGDDDATAIAVDRQGNVYVTGSSSNTDTPADYATVKYNARGVLQWVARSNVGADSPWPVALLVDDKSNIYLTGMGYRSGHEWDYKTIKYNSKGTEQWTAFFDGPSFLDRPNALAVDVNGNVYVTGFSYGETTFGDYATVKYNASGIQEWVARFNGSGNSYDEANSLAVDGLGNVYVTGESFGSGTRNDYTTVKYNPDGSVHWVAYYDSPEHAEDEATALAIDGWGTVYVAGRSAGGLISTIKYIEEERINQPRTYYLSQNFPNPFNPSTKIRYRLQSSGFVSLKVYNLLGQEVESLVNAGQNAGEYEIHWSPSNIAGGVYLYRLQAGAFVEAKKLVLFR